jgi:hypothetical protein
MTQVFTVDRDNDLVIGTDGNLSRSAGLEAVLQACEQAAKAQLGEMVLSVDQGVPNFQTVWNGSPNVQQFEGYLRRQLLRVEGVIAIKTLVASASNNVLSYTATIETIYGEGALNGGL